MEKIKVSDKIKLVRGECLDVLKNIPDNSIHSIVTDPPYGLTNDIDMAEVMKCWLNGTQYHHPKKGFMGKDWDSFVPGPEVWRECYRVLKPGGYLVSFGGTRTYDLVVLAIRLAGFEMRDKFEFFYDESEDVNNFLASLSPEQINALGRIKDQNEFLGSLFWLYGQGFPKSMDVAIQIDKVKRGCGQGKSDPESPLHGKYDREKVSGNTKHDLNGFYKNIVESDKSKKILTDEDALKWEGWGTALKPANEPICLARKPLEGTVANNVLKWGTGGINVDGSRIESEEIIKNHSRGNDSSKSKGIYGNSTEQETHQTEGQKLGRFPANIILDETAAKALDEQTGILKTGNFSQKGQSANTDQPAGWKTGNRNKKEFKGDEGGASRYFYVAKASTSERNKGLENRISEKVNDGRDTPIDNPFQRGESLRKNTHPTVKPINLIKYLIKLVTPKGGVCLDLYNGSGTAGCAIALLNKEGDNNFSYLGIDRTEEYIEISKSRIEYYLKDEVEEKPIEKEVTKDSEEYFE